MNEIVVTAVIVLVALCVIVAARAGRRLVFRGWYRQAAVTEAVTEALTKHGIADYSLQVARGGDAVMLRVTLVGGEREALERSIFSALQASGLSPHVEVRSA